MNKYENFDRRIKMEWVFVQEILIFQNFKSIEKYTIWEIANFLL